MGYPTSNAAYAYDMQPEPYGAPAPAPASRPRLDVVPGAGREADQAASPVFTHCIKVFCALVAIFVAVGAARVAIAGLTASTLDGAAALSSKLEQAHESSASLEVANSVYGSSTRIRDLAAGWGMVSPEGDVVLDFSQQAPAADGAGAAAQR